MKAKIIAILSAIIAVLYAFIRYLNNKNKQQQQEIDNLEANRELDEKARKVQSTIERARERQEQIAIERALDKQTKVERLRDETDINNVVHDISELLNDSKKSSD